ncbi:Y-family DNA polymerase [Paenalcaligenes sp. Me131]|uniref:Y-family DNA polymerase n=1 Tax=Paenalcaligenes sp. Me131 TaxID=3392636 RepID=UPI003D29ED3F
MDTQKPRTRIALIDGNSFYCSCERAMHPAYERLPLVVLSNNDGCAIARTAEAKNLGIKMGAPWFQIKHLAQSHGLIALSANFRLYADLSRRMMNVIGQFSPRQEIYSIDESFLDLSGIQESGRELGQAIRKRVKQWVGIPTCVGIGSTRTLAKLANHLAKDVPRLDGVCDLSMLDGPQLMRAIRHVPIDQVWGVGRRLSKKLLELNIRTAADLAQADRRVIRDKFSIVLAKTARELHGDACLTWDEVPAERQQIMYSRSFGSPVYTKEDLAQAVSTFATAAAVKLRAQNAKTSSLLLFIRTSSFGDSPHYSGSTVFNLLHATNSTTELNAAALKALDHIYRQGAKYTKAGVCLLDIENVQTHSIQGSLFDIADPIEQSTTSNLMQVIDDINLRFGRGMIAPARTLGLDDAPWKTRQKYMTPACTTDWKQIIEIWR